MINVTREELDASYVEAERRFRAGEQYSISTHIGEDISIGYGELDRLGFWEFPLHEGWGFDADGKYKYAGIAFDEIHARENFGEYYQDRLTKSPAYPKAE